MGSKRACLSGLITLHAQKKGTAFARTAVHIKRDWRFRGIRRPNARLADPQGQTNASRPGPWIAGIARARPVGSAPEVFADAKFVFHLVECRCEVIRSILLMLLFRRRWPSKGKLLAGGNKSLRILGLV